MRRISMWIVTAALLGWGNAWALTCNYQNTSMPASTDGAFSISGGGAIVTDNRTGLEWMRCSEGQVWNGTTCEGSASTYTWTEALGLARDSTFDGGGWRLPNKKELRSLLEQRCWSPSIDTAIFPNTVSSPYKYWSSTSYSPNPSYAYTVEFEYGTDEAYGHNVYEPVRLVRGGHSFDSYDLLGTTLATTTTIDSDNPDPSVVGETVTVAFSVSGGSPTGDVTVTATTGESCTGTLSGGSSSCTIVFNTTGSRDLTATYNGDADYDRSASAVESHQVDPVPGPTASFTASPNPAACGQSVTFDGSGSSAGHAIRTLQSWDWDFGDGSIDSGETTSHAFSAFGSYQVTLTVTDDGAATDTDIQTVDVNLGNTPPVADAGGPYAIVQGDSVTLDGSGSYDPNADCGDAIATYAWDIDNDGQYDNASGVGPTIPWSPQLSALGTGSHTIGLLVTDGFGATGTATTTLAIGESADLAVTKTDGATSAVPGTTLTYTIVATNNGPSGVTSAGLSDSFPAGLTCSWTSEAAGGASGNTASSGNLAESLDMPSVSSVTYTVTCTIAAGATGTLSNTATISSVVTDPDLTNNSATDGDTVLVGFSVTESGGTTQVDESGTTDSFEVVLTARPQSDVVISVTSGDTGEATVNETSLTFTPDNWDHPQTVTVIGVADGTLDGNQTVPVTLSVDDAHSDDAFDPLPDQTVQVTVVDTDVQTFTGPTATGTGDATLTISGGSCALDLGNTAFITTDGLNVPAGAQFTQGAVIFRVTGCAPGQTIEVTLIYPEALDNALAWKLDEVADAFTIAGAVVEGNTLRYSATDGGPLDQDGAEDGNFSDPVAPAAALNTVVPTLGGWGRWLLLILLPVLGWGVLWVRRTL